MLRGERDTAPWETELKWNDVDIKPWKEQWIFDFSWERGSVIYFSQLVFILLHFLTNFGEGNFNGTFAEWRPPTTYDSKFPWIFDVIDGADHENHNEFLRKCFILVLYTLNLDILYAWKASRTFNRDMMFLKIVKSSVIYQNIVSHFCRVVGRMESPLRKSDLLCFDRLR